MLVAGIVVYAIITREHYVPEFLEQSNVARTKELSNSSYRQETNHVKPEGRFELPPLQGTESPFRVNIWDSYIP